jgi:hypothetical protein
LTRKHKYWVCIKGLKDKTVQANQAKRSSQHKLYKPVCNEIELQQLGFDENKISGMEFENSSRVPGI